MNTIEYNKKRELEAEISKKEVMTIVALYLLLFVFIYNTLGIAFVVATLILLLYAFLISPNEISNTEGGR